MLKLAERSRPPSSSPQVALKLGYTRQEAAAATGVSLSMIIDAVSTGELHARKMRRKWIIAGPDLWEWFARQ